MDSFWSCIYNAILQTKIDRSVFRNNLITYEDYYYRFRTIRNCVFHTALKFIKQISFKICTLGKKKKTTIYKCRQTIFVCFIINRAYRRTARSLCESVWYCSFSEYNVSLMSSSLSDIDDLTVLRFCVHYHT